MTRPRTPRPGAPEPAPAEDRSGAVPPWVVQRRELVGSTNDEAAALPAWHAVLAERQTGGRGRWQRPWVSDAGGLWLSAVVPTSPADARWAALPLAAGVVVAETLRQLGVPRLRLRWPNDLLVGDRKIAGLLVEQFRPGTAVVGVGINVRNRPESQDSALVGCVTRLAEWLDPVPSVETVTTALLERLQRTVGEMQAGGFEVLVERVNALWDAPRHVVLELDHGRVEGRFEAVDGRGRLRLRDADGTWRDFEPHQVRMLRERDVKTDSEVMDERPGCRPIS